jgi:energy-coupling factor transport system ATP-binding protein
MGLDEAEIDRRVRSAAAFVGLPDEALEKSPFETLRGQKRRVAIAGVIAMEPSVLVLDEPTAVWTRWAWSPSCAIFTTTTRRKRHHHPGLHSMEEVARTVDRLVVVSGGRIPSPHAPGGLCPRP